ncbi:MAG: helix-turn-helix domain-containing protein [Thermodesulfobacteriota bacterium]
MKLDGNTDLRFVGRWLNLTRACEYAGMSRNTLLKYIREGYFWGEKLPSGHWRVDRESIDNALSDKDHVRARDILRRLAA